MIKIRIVKIPNGEYYIEKGQNRGLGAFIFRANAISKKGGQINMTHLSVPSELMGKKLMLRVEVIK